MRDTESLRVKTSRSTSVFSNCFVCDNHDRYSLTCIFRHFLTISQKNFHDTYIVIIQKRFSQCQECPVVKPTFLCGNDNRTYSSPCRLEYHNCIHHTSVHIACKGFCPCKVKIYKFKCYNSESREL
ncbi:hypothetical protein ACFW04_007418 [Cataglyphis niger]